MEPQQQDGWHEWSRYVLKELERLNSCVDKIDRKVSNIQTEIAMLKVKSGAWGVVGGAIPVLIYVLIRILEGK